MFSPGSNYSKAENNTRSIEDDGGQAGKPIETLPSPTSVRDIMNATCPSNICNDQNATSCAASKPLEVTRSPSTLSKRSVESENTSNDSDESSCFSNASAFDNAMCKEMDVVTRELFANALGEPHWTANVIQEEMKTITMGDQNSLVGCFMCGNQSYMTLAQHEEGESTSVVNRMQSTLDEQDEEMERLMSYTKGEAVLKLSAVSPDGEASLAWVLSAESNDEGRIADFHYEEQNLRTLDTGAERLESSSREVLSTREGGPWDTNSKENGIEVNYNVPSEDHESSLPVLTTMVSSLSTDSHATASPTNASSTTATKKTKKLKFLKSWKSGKKSKEKGFEI